MSLSKLTKYCACHEKWISWLILVTHETLFTMRGATSVIVQTHGILRLPRKMNLMIDPCHTWNAIYNARSNKCHCPNSPNTAPATQNDSPKFPTNFSKTAETSFPMRDRSETVPRPFRPWNRQSATRLATEVTFHAHHEHFVLKNTTFRAPAIIPNFTEYCACHEKWHFNFTKYCACHEKWISWLILVTHETLITMRGLTSVIVQTHQILRLPRKMTLMIDPCHTWNAIYNARSNKCHCLNSPNIAPATKNESHDWSLSHMKRYLQCAEQRVSLSKLTEYCACHAKWLSKISDKFLENSWNVISNARPIRDRSETVPRPFRPWNRQSATCLATEVTFHAHHEHFVLKNTTFRAPAIIPNFTEYCACHEKWHFNFTKYCACHEKWHLNLLRLWHLDWAMTWLSYDHDWATTWLSYDLTELLLDWAMTWLSYDWLDWAMTWLSYDLTELLLDWAMTWLSYDWLDWAMTWLSYDLTWLSTWHSCYLTELWLDWAITWLSYDLTELWLGWAMTWLSYDLAELWLDWAMTWLSYDLTELWLDWAMTWLSYDLTELLLDWAMTWLSYGCDLIRISEVSHLNFLW